MPSDRENRIKERAHAIWERAGRPHGQDQQHWAQAEAEIAEEDRSAKPAGQSRSIVETVVETAATVAGAAFQAAADVVTGRRTAASPKKPRTGKAAKEGAEGAGEKTAKSAKAAAPKPTVRAKKAAKSAAAAPAEKTSGDTEKRRGRVTKKETGAKDTAAGGKSKTRGRGKTATQASV